MDNFQRFLTEKNLNEDEVFVLLVGQENDILPGAEYYNYYVIVKTNEMVCYDNNDFNKEYHISFSSFQQAEFGFAEGNLWIISQVNGSFFAFGASRKMWKSGIGKKLVDKLGYYIGIDNEKAYNKFVGIRK